MNATTNESNVRYWKPEGQRVSAPADPSEKIPTGADLDAIELVLPARKAPRSGRKVSR